MCIGVNFENQTALGLPFSSLAFFSSLDLILIVSLFYKAEKRKGLLPHGTEVFALFRGVDQSAPTGA